MKIGILCGDSHETWSPKSVETGIGGSEEAVINIAKQFKKLGHDVTVWNNCGDDEGEYDGVPYIDYLDYDEREVDIMVGWRTASPWKMAKNFKKGYLWLHDTVPMKTIAQAMELGADKVMVLSKYHRRLYPSLRNEEVFLTRNGIDPTHFDQKIERVPHRMFWGSSYDRGLKEVLENWPKIKLAVPDATLHICYGWNTMERQLGTDSRQYKDFREDIENLMDQDGVKHLGRISHAEVAKEMMEADIWGYPTWWPEISCITAMKAQAAGAWPVVSPTAAVAETVVYGYKTDRGYYKDIQGNHAVQPKEMLDQWVEAVTHAMTKPNEDKRQQMVDWAKHFFSWEETAKQWVREFENEL